MTVIVGAAIARATAAGSPEIEQGLPADVFAALENGRFGRDSIQSLDAQLLAHIR